MCGGLCEGKKLLDNLIGIWDKKQNFLEIEQRPDLVRRHEETATCLRYAAMQEKCRVVLWPELAAACCQALRLWHGKNTKSERGLKCCSGQPALFAPIALTMQIF